MRLLTNVEFHTDTNNWYAPLAEFWGSHKSVHTAEYMDQTSSAGDWSGFIVQRTGKKKVHAIGFSQENSYPGAGFTLRTCGHPFYEGTLDEEGLLGKIRMCWNQFPE